VSKEEADVADRDEMMLTFQSNMYVEHPMSVYRDAGFLKYVEFLHSADVSFGNMEGAIIDGNEWPNFGSGMGWAGSYLGAPPLMVDELKLIGMNAMCAANNHAADFGEQGILSTMKHLRAGGIPFAGIGASFTEAAEPCYISTAHGRVALIAAADWGPRENMDLPTPWPAGYMGSDDGPHYTSRPGVNLLRYEAVLQVDQAALDDLKRISGQLDWERAKAGRVVGGGQATQPLHLPERGWEKDTETQFHFMGRRFELSDHFGFTTFPFQEDLDRLVKSVRDARRSADVVVVALHDQVHGDDSHDYIRTTARACIDAGADIFLCNGGIWRGIEIYEGKVILHGQQSFGFQNSQVRHVPPSLLRRKGLGPDASAADFYKSRRDANVRGEAAGGLRPIMPEQPDGIIHAVVFDSRCEVQEVRAYPAVNLGSNRHRLPALVEPGSERFHNVLKRASDLSGRLNTPFQARESYGVVEVK
jgi:poly-gamma-glutamate synthesis protein (capsule biosynthesis protein)